MTIFFDRSLAKFCQVIVNRGHENLLVEGIFVRQANGSLQLVVKAEQFNNEVHELSSDVKEALGPYAQVGSDTLMRDTDSPVVDRRHLALPETVALTDQEEITVRLIDQRSGGVDWLRPPVSGPETSPPRMVFWSFKGGVGRTTALAVLATSIARSGKNVLVLDLDLEAPGIGDFLLNQFDCPRFGVLDYLVEDLVGSDQRELLESSVGTSSIVHGQGLIDVCPAFGTESVANPGNYLAKLYRAYSPKPTVGGDPRSFADRVSMMVSRLESRRAYDAILIDARAGLNESTAAAIVGLGADVLMFGHMTAQTFSGYNFALANMARFIGSQGGNWRMRLKMVHAKASVSPEQQREFVDKSFDLFSQWLYEPDGDYSFSIDDINAMHFPWVIFDDSNYKDFDPLSNPALLASVVANATFGAFVSAARDRLRID